MSKKDLNPFTNVNPNLKGKLSTAKILNKDTGNMDAVIIHEKHSKDGVLDPNMIPCEIYNPGRETILFTNMIFPNGAQHIQCKPDDFCYLPHQYYTGVVPSGNQEIRVIKNYGDAKFLGNKHPSSPDGVLK